VRLSQVCLSFIKKEGGVEEYCKALQNISDEKYLTLESTRMLIDAIWDKSFNKIVYFSLLPYMIYFSCFVVYISFYYDIGEDTTWVGYVLLPLCFLYSCMQLIFEIKQMRNEGADYFASVGVIMNFFDIGSSLTVILFSFLVLSGYDKETGKLPFIIGSAAVFLLWLKVLSFLRLFQHTSFFIKMIIQMFIDIRSFLIVFFVAIFAFADTFYVLDMIFKLNGVDMPDYDDYHQEPITDFEGVAGGTYPMAVKYVYLQSLGELGIDFYDDIPLSSYYWGLFFFSTIFL
jgi:hypothetical protein